MFNPFQLISASGVRQGSSFTLPVDVQAEGCSVYRTIATGPGVDTASKEEVASSGHILRSCYYFLPFCSNRPVAR